MAEKKTAKKADADSFVVPIKVTNRPIIKDPTPTDSRREDNDDLSEAPAEKATVKPVVKPDIKPLDTTLKKPEPESEPKPSDEPTDPEPAVKDLEQAELDDAALQAEHDESIQKLVVSKKYVLPINSVEKRRSRRFVMLGIVLSFVLLVAWADVALDAGLIHFNGIKPVTHFFSN